MNRPSSRRISPGQVLRRAAACLGLASCLAAAPAAAFDLEGLLKGLAAEGRREIGFEEQRYIAALSEPVVTRGHFTFEPPDRLVKVIEAPRRESAVMEEDRLAILDGEGRETASIDLWLQPDLRLIFGSVRAVLRGDAAALRAIFWVSLAGDEAAWRLNLKPKVDAAKTHLDSIAISGRAKALERFEVLKSDGGRSVIRFVSGDDAP